MSIEQKEKCSEYQKKLTNIINKKTNLQDPDKTIVVNNIEYIQLNTVNQFNEKVISDVAKKHKTVTEEIKKRDYAPGATCGSLSIINAILISNFLQNKINVKLLDEINNQEKARNFLKESIDNNEPVSWLENKFIYEKINRLRVDDKIRVLSSVLGAEKENGLIEDVAKNFQSAENYYHVFIVGTADTYCSANLKKYKELKEVKNNNHWYVVAIEKKEKTVQCLIIDTDPRNNHIENKNLLYRNQFLCECIIYGRSKINYRDIIKRATLEKEAKQVNDDIRKLSSGKSISGGEEFVRGLYLPKTTLDSIKNVYPPEIKKEIVRKYKPDRIKVLGSKVLPSSILLHGPYGQGKTCMAGAIGDDIEREVYIIDATLLANTFSNSPNKNLEAILYIFSKKNKPYVLVIDEVDVLTKERGPGQTGNFDTDMSFGSLLDRYRDNKNLFFVCTTNNYDQVKDRFDSRFGRQIYINLKNSDHRKDIIKCFMKEAGEEKNLKVVFEEGLNLDYAAKKTTDFCLRKIKRVINDCYSIAGDRSLEEISQCKTKLIVITKEDFDKVANRMQKVINQRKNAKRYKAIKEGVQKWGPISLGVAGLGYTIYHNHKKPKISEEEALGILIKQLTCTIL